MKKYLTMFSSCLKSQMIYRMDTLLSAAFSFFSVLMFYLLWKLLIPQGGTLQGFTLGEMTTYTMISTAIAPMMLEDSTMFSMADEIRTGRFARYLHSPISPFAAFVSQSLAATLPRFAISTASCVAWGFVFRGIVAPISLTGLLACVPVLILAMCFMLLLNYLLTCCAFRYTDILGIVFIRGSLVSFFAGGMAPLEVLFGGAPLWSPFYYLTNYPAMLLMGREAVSPWLACAVLCAASAVLLALCLTVARRSRKYFEGVGA